MPSGSDEDFAARETRFFLELCLFPALFHLVAEACRVLTVADMEARFGLTESSHNVEIAANDGYLLQYAKARNIPASASSRRQHGGGCA